MKQQTAVEKLRDAFYSYATQDVRSVDNSMWIIDECIFGELIDAAQGVMKKQIIDAWYCGHTDGATICSQKEDLPAEKYYNETYTYGKKETE
jgi:hypothetical protein